jgi:hypothetical protein
MTTWCSRMGFAVMLVAAGCSGKTLDPTGSGIPAGCEGVLQQRETGEARCDASPQQCAQIRRGDTRPYQFTFTFSKAQDTKALTCLVDFLEGHGAKAESAGGAVTATGTFGMVAPALRLAIVADYMVTCLACTECSRLASDQCAQDAFCAPITGKRTNPTNSCLEPTQTIGCMETPNGCLPEPSAVLDPQGACWLVDCGGEPAGWMAVGGQSCPGASLGSPPCP